MLVQVAHGKSGELNTLARRRRAAIQTESDPEVAIRRYCLPVGGGLGGLKRRLPSTNWNHGDCYRSTRSRGAYQIEDARKWNGSLIRAGGHRIVDPDGRSGRTRCSRLTAGAEPDPSLIRCGRGGRGVRKAPGHLDEFPCYKSAGGDSVS